MWRNGDTYLAVYTSDHLAQGEVAGRCICVAEERNGWQGVESVTFTFQNKTAKPITASSNYAPVRRLLRWSARIIPPNIRPVRLQH